MKCKKRFSEIKEDFKQHIEMADDIFEKTDLEQSKQNVYQ